MCGLDPKKHFVLEILVDSNGNIVDDCGVPIRHPFPMTAFREWLLDRVLAPAQTGLTLREWFADQEQSQANIGNEPVDMFRN